LLVLGTGGTGVRRLALDCNARQGRAPDPGPDGIDVELADAGELVFQQGLADAPQAKTVDVQEGVPVASNGSFAESRESSR
jgi:hypothetical protein